MAEAKPNLADHAREISFAVFRVAKLVEQPKLKAALESAAVDLVSQCGDVPYLSYVPSGAHLPYLPYIEKLAELVRLAEMVGEVRSVNSHVLQRELQTLYSMIAESFGKKEEVNLEDSFKKIGTTEVPAVTVVTKETQSEEPKPARFELPQITPVNFDNALTRQSAILDFIKQLPNGCRMKDLMAKFTSVSERTLRNDLQILTAEDKIERFGAVQGPFSYFRLKTATPTGDLPAAPATQETGLGTVTKNEIISL